ncbi:hypothetical protein FRC11_013509 [Ceratobasidium sp. 423]|nr:hypothetical protein FRC11_013509 [Ceratobasidium sp. 423]
MAMDEHLNVDMLFASEPPIPLSRTLISLGMVSITELRIITVATRHAMVQVHDQEHKFLAVMVQRFVPPAEEPVFPWDYWQEFLGIDAWEYDQFTPVEPVPVSAFSGVFVLSDIHMLGGHFWLTFAMLKTRPEDLADDHDDN